MKYLFASIAMVALVSACGETQTVPEADPAPVEPAVSSAEPEGVAPVGSPTMAGLAGASVDQLTVAQIVGLPSIDVTSETFAAGQAIPLENSAYGDNFSPQLSWGAGPEGTQSYVVIMEDPDLPGRPPFLHWIIGDLPADMTSLPAGLVETPEGAFQTGVRGATYFGPRPPSGLHNYTFQVFALDERLELDDGAKLDDVKAKMTGHALAVGVLQGTYAAPEN